MPVTTGQAIFLKLCCRAVKTVRYIYINSMKVQRWISWFDKSTDKLVGEMNVDQIPITYLKTLFSPPANDPLLYNPYTIRQFQAKRLAGYVTLEFDLNYYIYQLDCYQVR